MWESLKYPSFNNGGIFFLPHGTIYPTVLFLQWDFDGILDGMEIPPFSHWVLENWGTIIGKL